MVLSISNSEANEDVMLSKEELPDFISQEVETVRKKRAIPVAAIGGIVSMLSNLVGDKLKGGLDSKLGSNITSGLVKGLVDSVMKKILEKDHMEDIHNEITEYLNSWQDQSDKNAAAVSKNLKSVIDSLVKKNSELLESKAKINIIPQKGMDLQDMFTPAGYKIETSYKTNKAEPDSSVGSAYVYDQGIGNVVINGCYKPSLNAHDPCHAAKRLLPLCDQQLEGATFIGVGFDGRGYYSSSSRRKSIIQRVCLRGQNYMQRSVPDIMTVHGIYDTDVKTMAFSSMSRYQQYLEKKSSVARSGYMFMDAVTKAYGKGSAGFLGLAGAGGGFSVHGEIHASAQTSSSQSSHSISQQDTFQQMYMSLLEIEIARYEIFMDDVKPHDLNMDFLHDFVFLPTSYFHIGAPQKYQNFLLRYGTHYIKSAKFGGSLRLYKTKRGSKTESVNQFASKAQNDYKAMFSTYMAAAAQFKSRSLFHKAEGGAEGEVSAGGGTAGSSETETQSSQSSAQQQQYSNEVLSVEGGDQTIAAVISEMYTVGFKHELVDWLQSIPIYPKPIEMQMAQLSEICNINWKHLFPQGVVDFGCFHGGLETELSTGRKYYTWSENITDPNDNTSTTVKTERHYCDFTDQQQLENSMLRRCRSLKRAIDVYLEEGPTPVNDIHLPAGRAGCETAQLAFDDIRHDLRTPAWNMLTDGREFKVIFDMPDEIPGVTARSSVLQVRFRPANKKWYVKSADEIAHLYDGWGNGGSGDVNNKKMSIRGLVMSYDTETGLLLLAASDFTESRKVLPDLSANLTGRILARVEYLHILHEIKLHKNEFGIGTVPCNLVWSNAHRLNPAVVGGHCISFAAISSGDIFVVFAAIPDNKDTWYYVQISPNGVAIYKGLRIMKFIDDVSSRGLGSNTLFQLYFVCIKEEEESQTTTILYGKTQDSQDRGHVYAAFHDTGANLHVRFYAFGNGDREVDIMDSHVLRTSATGEHVCVGDTIEFQGTCIEDCHAQCEGCHTPNDPTKCRKCKNFKLEDECVASCPNATHQVGIDGVTCICKIFEDGKCVTECSDDRVAVDGHVHDEEDLSNSMPVKICKCRFIDPDQESVCLPGCPLTTHSNLQSNQVTHCILCHAVCKPQAEGVPICSGPASTQCTECYTITPASSVCKVCPAGRYLSFQQNANNPICTTCQYGYQCPGDGRRYQCSVTANEFSHSNRRSCVTCPANQYSTIPASNRCHTCSPGFYKKTWIGKCIQCPGNTAGQNCQVTCGCKYGRCIKVDGSCSCWKFFKGHNCETPTEGALRLVDDRVFNKFTDLLTVAGEYQSVPTAEKDRQTIGDAVNKVKVSLLPEKTDGIAKLPDTRFKVAEKNPLPLPVAISRKVKRALPSRLDATVDVQKELQEHQVKISDVATDSITFKDVLKHSIDLSGKIRGRLEIYHNGQWGTACDSYWSEMNTKVACRQFYYKYGVARKNAYFGRGTGPIWLTKVHCHGNEKSLNSCPRPKYWALNIFNNKKMMPCLHKDDIGLFCY